MARLQGRFAVSYLGAKTGSGVYQAIIALMRPHDTYLEPFVGSGAILTRKGPAALSIVLDKDPAAIAAIEERDDLVRLVADALPYLEGFKVGADLGRVLIYADPPYLLSTRTGRDRYLHEFTNEDHGRLAAALRRLGAEGVAVIVSGYPSDLYDRLYDGWSTMQFQTMTRGGVRTEKVWFNFDPGDAHWHTFAGRDFTDRQRIKRKAARWAAKFKALAPAEAQAVLAAILAEVARDPT